MFWLWLTEEIIEIKVLSRKVLSISHILIIFVLFLILFDVFSLVLSHILSLNDTAIVRDLLSGSFLSNGLSAILSLIRVEVHELLLLDFVVTDGSTNRVTIAT